MVQNHIHIGTSLGPAPENAPTQIYRVSQRVLRPIVKLSVNITLGGKTRLHRLTDGGNTKIFMRHEYVVKINAGVTPAWDQVETLIGLLGETIYLCDNEHANDGADHTADIVQAYFTEIPQIESISPGLNLYYIPIVLERAYL